jgi:hypothetical protein
MQSRTVLNLRWTLTPLDELQSSQSCVTALADDDVVVDGNANRVGEIDDRFRHGPWGRRIAGRGDCAASDYAN